MYLCLIYIIYVSFLFPVCLFVCARLPVATSCSEFPVVVSISMSLSLAQCLSQAVRNLHLSLRPSVSVSSPVYICNFVCLYVYSVGYVCPCSIFVTFSVSPVCNFYFVFCRAIATVTMVTHRYVKSFFYDRQQVKMNS